MSAYHSKLVVALLSLLLSGELPIVFYAKVKNPGMKLVN